MNRIYKTREGAITAVEMAAERLERHILSVPTSMALKNSARGANNGYSLF